MALPGRDAPTLFDNHLAHERAVFGADLCTVLGLSQPIALAVANHHSRFDAHSSAQGGQSERSPFSRIISVAEAFASMTSPRPYAPRRSIKQALAEIRQERGRQFDPDVVDTIHFVGEAVWAAAA